MSVDCNAVFREVLVASGTDLHTLNSDRVWGGRGPSPEVWKNTETGILFWRRGGINDARIPLWRPSWQVECYGGSDDPSDADAVYRALVERLRDLELATTSEGVLLNCVEEESGQDLVDEETGWPLVLSFWTSEIRAAS